MANNEEITLHVSENSPYVIGARAYVEQTENGAVITIIDKEGTTTATVSNGKGIASATLNEDYTLTLIYTDGTSVTTTSIRGEQGESGVYCGSEEPDNPDVDVWIDPTGDPYPMEDEIADAVDEWITAHPEYVTTVQDGAITVPKFAAGVVDTALNKVGYPAESKATGDAIAADRTRLTAVEGEADALDARITNLAQLTDGSTTGDAELMDARVVGSTTYSTLHEAIDTEFTNVKSEINDMLFADDCPWIKELYINADGVSANVEKVNNFAVYTSSTRNDFRLLFANSAGDAFTASTGWYPLSDKPTGIIPIYNILSGNVVGTTVLGYMVADFSFVSTAIPITKPITTRAYRIDFSSRIQAYLSSVIFDKAQFLSDKQSAQARDNIGAVAVSELEQSGAIKLTVDNTDDFVITNKAYEADGTYKTYVGWNTTDYISCVGWDRIAFNLVGFNHPTLGIQLATIAFFDENKAFISSIAIQSTSTSAVVFSGGGDIPATAHYFKALDYPSVQPNPTVKLVKIGTLEEKVNNCVSKYDVYSRKVGEKHITDTDLSQCTTSGSFYNPLFTNGFVAPCDGLLLGVRTLSGALKIGVYVAKGLYSQSREWRCYAEGIPVITSKVVEETVDNITAWVSSYNLEIKKGDEVYVRFMDGTLKYGGTGNSFNALQSLSASTIMTVEYAVSFNLIYAELEDDVDEQSEIKNLKICAIGDSLTQGVDIYKHVYAESYPYWLSRYLGSKVLNYGQMGRTAQTWWNNYKTYYSYDSSIDVVLIMFGTNGGLSSNTLATDVEPYNNWADYADTNCGDYCKLIEYIMEQTSNHAQIFLITPPHSTYTTAQDNTVVASEATIRAIAKRYSLPVIDVLNECGMGKFNGSVFRPNDGCHFNAKGYHRLGTFIGSRVKAHLSNFSLTDEFDDEYISS